MVLCVLGLTMFLFAIEVVRVDLAAILVNALVIGPAGYRVADGPRTGGIMTVLFLVLSQGVMALVS